MAPLAKVILGTAVALSLTSTLAAPISVIDSRQLAGEGNLFDSLFTDTDSGVGYGVENAEDHIAEMLGGSSSTAGGSSGGGAAPGQAGGPPPPPPPPRRLVKTKRQGDKVANGAAAILNAAKLTDAAGLVQTDGDNIDGQLTDDATNVGAQFGGDEEDILERLGDMVPSKLPTAPATKN